MDLIYIFVIHPLIVVVGSVIGYQLIKKWYVTPFLTFVVYFYLSLILDNDTYFIWAIFYTSLSLLISVTMKYGNRIN